MQGYESIFILDPEVNQDQQKGLLEKFKSIVDKNGGSIVHHDEWGRRKLAYEVKKRSHGVYHMFYLDNTPDALRALENQFRLEDDVIKWLSVSVEDVEEEFGKYKKLKSEGTIAQNMIE
ncbi:MAG: 30S ribosomal protein S6 [Deltaproteobacteria bacterium]|nr:30S ribosomal protein S6 [Deltaproteobacteria bacterium]